MNEEVKPSETVEQKAVEQKAKQFIGENTVIVSQDELDQILKESEPELVVTDTEVEVKPEKKGFWASLLEEDPSLD